MESEASQQPSKYLSDYAEKLLDRQADASYVSMWEDLLKREKQASLLVQEGSLLIFRIGDEWLGLSTKFVESIIEKRLVHTVPSTRIDILRGVINVRGQLRLCVNLHSLLEITSEQISVQGAAKKHSRMMVIRRGGEVWVFGVDEVYGAINCDFHDLENVPVNVSKSTTNYLKGIWKWQNQSIGVLDEELLFESLRRFVF